jgi:succinate-acetate transporter protein
MNSRLGDSSVFGLSTFGFALAVLGTQLTLSSSIAGATVYAVLVAAIGETLAGLWAIARGDGYLAGILTTFGLWLFGYYFFLTAGMAAGLVTPKAEGMYVLLLIVPLAYLTVPAVRARRAALSLALAAVLLTLLSVGLGAYFSKSALLTTGGYLSLASALLVWFLAAEAAQKSFTLAHSAGPEDAGPSNPAPGGQRAIVQPEAEHA